MGYQVEYSPGQRKRYPLKKDRKIVRTKIIYTVFGCVAVLLLYSLHRTGVLREILIPGDADVTQAAAKEMIGKISRGENIRETLQAFCVDILINAQIY